MQSVERAFGVLRCLASGPAGVSEIADRLSLPKSTVSRLLSTLQSLDAVAQVDHGTEYRVGDLMTEIAGGTNPGQHLISIARPHLTELVTLVGETAGLAVLDGGEAHYLDHVEADHVVQMRNWTGEWIPAHVVPSGLVMMAFLPEMEAEELLSRPLERFTGRSIVKQADVRKRLTSIRDAGYVWAIEEYSEELNSVAAPVRDAGRHRRGRRAHPRSVVSVPSSRTQG